MARRFARYVVVVTRRSNAMGIRLYGVKDRYDSGRITYRDVPLEVAAREALRLNARHIENCL